MNGQGKTDIKGFLYNWFQSLPVHTEGQLPPRSVPDGQYGWLPDLLVPDVWFVAADLHWSSPSQSS